MDQAPHDALLPPEIAARAEALGARKATADTASLFVLAILAGAFIALGAVFATVVASNGGALPYGINRLISGLVFSLGLILVVVAGAELFTGNNLIVMAWASRRISLAQLFRNWSIVYAGNLVGAALTAAAVFLAGHHEQGGGAVGATALTIAEAKCSLDITRAFFLGALCNALVCLAVWLTLGARSVADKVLAVIFPIAAFVAAGFEHCVANMYFIPIGLLIKGGANEGFWTTLGQDPSRYEAIGVKAFVLKNLLPVTLGNVFGGAVMVGLVYWFVYLRRRP